MLIKDMLLLFCSHITDLLFSGHGFGICKQTNLS